MNRLERVIAIPVSSAGCCLPLLLVMALGSAATAVKADEVTLDLRIERGRVPASMRLIRAKQGDTVKLRWNSDRPLTLHLHGYDVEQKIEPDKVTEMTFIARATGRFPVEIHAARQGGRHTHETPVVQIEIYPR